MTLGIRGILLGMIDALSALSLYRQLHALEENLRAVKDDPVSQFMAAYKNQGSFNHILSQITEQSADAPDYLKSFSHIEPADIPKGLNRSAYPRFLAKVQMLKQAIGAFIELALPPEQKKQIGFK
ncbi:MAG: hypothetical protein WBE41_21375 [Terracidiphilus sp.]